MQFLWGAFVDQEYNTLPLYKDVLVLIFIYFFIFQTANDAFLIQRETKALQETKRPGHGSDSSHLQVGLSHKFTQLLFGYWCYCVPKWEQRNQP